ncbi:MAG: hypothetical protein ACI3Z5_03915 [Paludibacteraceae bacterium]
MKKALLTLLVLSLMGTSAFAQTADTIAASTHKRYTFGDFFDALDLPTVLGAGFTPSGIESATFNSAMRLGWRHHKNYGAFAFISYDAHSNTYESLTIQGTNVRSGEVWYHEIGMGAGYRIPLVKDIRKFYEAPYFHPWDFFVSLEPGAKITVVKDVEPVETEGAAYQLTDYSDVIPTLRLSAGVEWFIFPNFGVFIEAAYTQHLMPTIVEQAAIDQGHIRHPSGPVTVSAGLSLFFN